MSEAVIASVIRAASVSTSDLNRTKYFAMGCLLQVIEVSEHEGSI